MWMESIYSNKFRTQPKAKTHLTEKVQGVDCRLGGVIMHMPYVNVLLYSNSDVNATAGYVRRCLSQYYLTSRCRLHYCLPQSGQCMAFKRLLSSPHAL